MTDLAVYEDKFGDERVIHKTRHGLKVKQTKATPILKLNQAIAGMIGERIRYYRQQRGYTLEELATRTGMVAGWPKNRMWEIENAVRKQGVRLGTLYALAMALDVPVAALLPPVDEVAAEAGVQEVEVPALA